MRLTGLTDVTLRALRPAIASSANEVASSRATTAAKNNVAEGIITARSAPDAEPPVDSERVAEIRKAIQEGNYPLVPAEIADAMIAAKLYGIVEA